MTKYTIGYAHTKKAEKIAKIQSIAGLIIIGLMIVITGFQAQI